MKTLTCVGIALRPATIVSVEKLASATGLSRTVYIRRVIEQSVADAETGVAPDIRRVLTLQEHQTLLLDALCRKLLPEQADRLARAALDAAKKHHGA